MAHFFGSNTDKPYIWTAENGTEVINLPESFTNGQLGNLSDDGEFGAGTLFQANDDGRIPESWRAAYWTQKDAMQSLGTLPGYTSSSANFGGISADGKVVVGRVQKQDGEDFVREAFRWTQESGMQGLGVLPGTVSSRAADISADGKVIVGDSGEPGSSLGDKHAFRWTSDGGMTNLGLPEGATAAAALGTNRDGTVVVGTHTSDDQLRALVWDAANGPRDLRQVLMNEHGLSEVPPLQRANHISDDTKTIAGSFPGFVIKLDRPLVVTSGVLGDFNGNAQLDIEDLDLLAAELQSERDVRLFDVNADDMVDFADRQFWVEELADTFLGDANLDKEVNFADFLALSAGFGEEGGWAEGDFDGDGQTRFEDFLMLSSNFGNATTSGEAVASVPEPSSRLLLIFGVLVLCRQRAQCHAT